MQAWYFDGRTSRRQEVHLSAGDGVLTVAGADWQRVEPRDGVSISEPIGRAPRTLKFPDGAYCEVQQGEELDTLLSLLGHRETLVARWQGSWRYAVVGLVLLLAVLGATYRWGLPWLAERTAGWMPQTVRVQLSDQVLRAFDGRLLTYSRVAPQRRERLELAFHYLVIKDPTLEGSQLLWRRGPRIGPNAFALPDGRIVLLDELVELAETDEEILGVLAHELGHVSHRHGVRQMIQSSVVSMVVASYLNDFSSVLSGLGSLLLQSDYSREFEREADDFSAALMHRAGYSTEGLVSMLAKLERVNAEEQGEDSDAEQWVSSHPGTQERIARLRAWRQSGPGR